MLVFFALSLTVLFGFCGLAVDVGRIELRKTQLQAAADAGVLSSAAELQSANPLWQNAATTEVTAMALANGYPVPTIVVQQAATYGAYAGDNSTVQITLTQQVSTYFLRFIGPAGQTGNLKVNAVAQRSGLSPVVLVD